MKQPVVYRDPWIDAARILAILSVVLFHFYSLNYRIEAGDYPYGGYPYFKYGFLGVQFFFILAGYLLLPSLERSASLWNFWKKKLVRLGVPLILCTLITWVFCCWVDVDNFMPQSHKWQNVLVSCLFIRPELLNLICGSNWGYINGSTWFLWPMIEFFIVATFLYGLSKKDFIRNFSVVSIALVAFVYCFRRVVENYFLTNKFGLPFSEHTMLLAKEWMWTKEYTKYAHLFLFGIGCYLLKNKNWKTAILLCSTTMLCNMLLPDSNYAICYVIMAIWILYSVLSATNATKDGGGAIFATIGESTYAVFLLHETIGMVLIHRFASSWGQYAWCFPIVLIVVFFVIAYVGYKYIEKPCVRWLLSKI